MIKTTLESKIYNIDLSLDHNKSKMLVTPPTQGAALVLLEGAQGSPRGNHCVT